MAATYAVVQAVQAGEGMRVGGARKAILPPELVGLNLARYDVCMLVYTQYLQELVLLIYALSRSTCHAITQAA